MIFRVTHKLAKKIKTTPVLSLPPNENPFLDWTAHLFMVSRWQCVILTHTRSLYSVVMAGRGIVSEKTFFERAVKSLQDYMALDGFGRQHEQCIGSETEPVTFCRAGDKRVLGSMNDLIYHARMHLLEDGLPLSLVNMRLNDMPMSMIKLHSPKLEFMSLTDQPRA